LLRNNEPPFSPKYRELLKARRELPVSQKRQEFLEMYQKSQVMILSSDTGSGKTTQIPQFVYFDEFQGGGKVVCTHPRRLTAMSIAKRVAEEMDVKIGEEVGYSVRFFEDTDQKLTRLVYMTDGKLVRKALVDSYLSEYSCIIIDEAHQRTTPTDFLMAILKNILSRRTDLKVVIMSARTDADKFQTYFNNAPILHVPGRNHPVDICYLTAATPDYLSSSIHMAKHIHQHMPKGDIMIFLTGEEEIERACARLKDITVGLDVMPLYSVLDPVGQQRAIGSSSSTSRRKCVITTNIAETSLTIDGIGYVVDCGRATRKIYNARARADVLQSCPISKAEANRRASQAGRTQPGSCFRMYTKETFDNVLVQSAQPGILRDEVTSLILQTKLIGPIRLTDFIDAPHPENILSGLEELVSMYVELTGY
jgi:pre-mRNA-splicing factor ATP-dependent RNA helicase DHX15/PRP43